MGFGYGRQTYHSETARNAAGEVVKSVFDNSMVAHVWATQGQTFGRSNNGNFYFKGRTIFSYGDHFPAGVILSGGRYLQNMEHASVTTSGHMSDVRRAARHLDALPCPELSSIAGTSWRALDVILSGATGATLDSARQTLAAHVAKHAAAMPEKTGEALLELSGHKRPAAQFVRLQRAALKRAADEKTADARETVKGHLRAARDVFKAAEDGEALADWKGRIRSDRHTLNQAATRYYHAHRAAKRAGFNRHAAAAWSVLKWIRESLAHLDRVQTLRDQRRTVRDAVATVRRTIPVLEREPAPKGWSAWHWNTAATAAEVCARVRPTARLIALATLWGGEAARLAAEERAAAEAARKAEAARRFAAEAEKRAAWLRGESVGYFYGSDENGGAMLRVVGDTLQTSHGASVPLDHATRAFKFLKLCHATGRDWKANGRTIPVGHFKISEVTPDRFVAGCHVIYWPEVERIARLVGVYDVTADESPLVATAGH